MRIVTGEVPFHPTFAPTGLGEKFDGLSGAELMRWALRNSVPNVSADLGRQQLADAIGANLGKIHKDAGDQAVARFLANSGLPA